MLKDKSNETRQQTKIDDKHNTRETYKKVLYDMIGLASWRFIKVTQEIGYINELYTQEDFVQMRHAAT